VQNDRYPLSPRIVALKEILEQLRPEPEREPLPRAGITNRRARGDIAGAIRAMDTLADLGNWPSIEIGSHGVIRHAYQNVLNACARLASFATSAPTTTDGPIEQQQELLAADDLVTFGIHARRLIENTAKAKRFTQVTVRQYLTRGRRIPITRVINILIHHQHIVIVRSDFQLEMQSSRNPIEVLIKYSGSKHRYFPPVIMLTSDQNQTISFEVGELIETFQAKVLNPIIDLCGEHSLHLDLD
jgi:hypothetical protein